jgi:hypothetical protein
MPAMHSAEVSAAGEHQRGGSELQAQVLAAHLFDRVEGHDEAACEPHDDRHADQPAKPDMNPGKLHMIAMPAP